MARVRRKSAVRKRVSVLSDEGKFFLVRIFCAIARAIQEGAVRKQIKNVVVKLVSVPANSVLGWIAGFFPVCSG